MMRLGANRIISADADFGHLTELNRLDSPRVEEWETTVLGGGDR